MGESVSPYIFGNVRIKEAHAYIVESKLGPIQIGIPPETIKASMIKGGMNFVSK